MLSILSKPRICAPFGAIGATRATVIAGLATAAAAAVAAPAAAETGASACARGIAVAARIDAEGVGARATRGYSESMARRELRRDMAMRARKALAAEARARCGRAIRLEEIALPSAAMVCAPARVRTRFGPSRGVVCRIGGAQVSAMAVRR